MACLKESDRAGGLMVPRTGCSMLVRSAAKATGAGSRGICIREDVEAGILNFWYEKCVISVELLEGVYQTVE